MTDYVLLKNSCLKGELDKLSAVNVPEDAPPKVAAFDEKKQSAVKASAGEKKKKHGVPPKMASLEEEEKV